MTDKVAVANALNLISEGVAALAIAIEAPGNGVTPLPANPAGAVGGGAPAPAVDLDRCVVHGQFWKIVPAGVSERTGKPYKAFAACPERGCKERPNQAWYDAHPL